MRNFLGGTETPAVDDDALSASEAPPVETVTAPIENPATAWARAVSRWVDEELRSTPVAHHPPGWEHLINVALPKLRGYVESELKGS